MATIKTSLRARQNKTINFGGSDITFKDGIAEVTDLDLAKSLVEKWKDLSIVSEASSKTVTPTAPQSGSLKGKAGKVVKPANTSGASPSDSDPFPADELAKLSRAELIQLLNETEVELGKTKTEIVDEQTVPEIIELIQKLNN